MAYVQFETWNNTPLPFLVTGSGTSSDPYVLATSPGGVAAVAPADNTATPAAAPPSLSFNMVYDGATWDFQRGDSTKGTLVYPALGCVVARPTITTSDTAYTAGDCIGGIISLGAIAFAAISPLSLRSIVLKDDANQKPSLQLLFFRSSPAGTYTDNAAVAPTTADMGNLVFCHTVSASDWVSIQGVAKAVVSYEIDVGPVLGPAASTLFMVIVAGATPPDYTASSTDLTAEIGLERSV